MVLEKTTSVGYIIAKSLNIELINIIYNREFDAVLHCQNIVIVIVYVLLYLLSTCVCVYIYIHVHM